MTKFIGYLAVLIFVLVALTVWTCRTIRRDFE
jgi:hypothetical protein